MGLVDPVRGPWSVRTLPPVGGCLSLDLGVSLPWMSLGSPISWRPPASSPPRSLRVSVLPGGTRGGQLRVRVPRMGGPVLSQPKDVPPPQVEFLSPLQ